MTTESPKLVWNEAKIPQTSTSVYEALYNRRMAWKFLDKPVENAAIERMLNAAVWAPNHRLNEPWRFFVLPKDSPLRAPLGDAVFDALVEEWKNERRAAPYREKLLDPPMLIYAYYVGDEDWFVDKENYAALCCALQNMSLAGVAEGLAVTWDTGRVTRVPAVDTILGAEENWKVTALLSIGYPDENSESSRIPADQLTKWV